MTVKPVLPIKVLLADDSEIMREAIKKLLVDEPRIHIVGEASCFGTAMQLVADSKPDLLLLDLHLPQKRELPAPIVRSHYAIGGAVRKSALKSVLQNWYKNQQGRGVAGAFRIIPRVLFFRSATSRPPPFAFKPNEPYPEIRA